MINEITDTLFFDYSCLIHFTVTNSNTDWNILISCSLWVLCFFSEGCVIYPTRNWWTLSFLTGSHIIYLVMCLNSNKYWCCVINVLNVTFVENFHLGLDGFSSTLLFVAEILALKHGIKTMINLNKFIQFIFKKLNCCLIKGRYVITKIRMISQIMSFISVWWITFCICEI